MTSHRTTVKTEEDGDWWDVTVTCTCGHTDTEEIERYRASRWEFAYMANQMIQAHYEEVRGEG